MGILKEFVKFRKTWKLHGAELELSKFAVGVNSTVSMQTDRHIVMLDYDIQDIDVVRASVKELQEFWKLTDAYVYKTKHGYHVIMWHAHVPYGRLKQIIEFAADVDPMYKAISQQYSHKTLRVAGKYDAQDIKFERIIPGVRMPSLEEWEKGEMKRKEHDALLRISNIYVMRK